MHAMSTELPNLISSLSLLFIIAITPTLSQLTNGNIGCFVDLSEESDRKTDIVVYSNQSIIAFKQGKARKGDTSMKERFQEYAQFDTGDNIMSVSAMDWTKNGAADLFVITKTTDQHETYHLNVWKDEEQQFVPTGAQTLELSNKHVLLLDADGDFYPDVFGKKSEKEGFWFGHALRKNFTTFTPLGVDQNTIEMQSVSFIDLDQDCRADLVYVIRNNETNTRHIRMISGRDFKHTIQRTSMDLKITMLDEYQSRLYFADINNDGVMDIIIPNRNSNKLHLFIQETHQALGFKELCKKKRDVTFKPSGGCDVTLKTEKEGYYLRDHLPIIVQDINMDSRTNLVALLENDDGEQKVFVTTIIFKNVDDLNGKQLLENKAIGALFNEYTEDSTNKISDLAFFHSGEFPLGLHFLIQRKDESFAFINLEPLLNDQNYGFLSVCPLNNVDPVKKKYGGTMPGVTVKAFFRSSNGQEIFLNSGSLYQTNSGNHLLPFIVIGLGEPESYIEKLVIGYSLYGSGRVHYFQQPGVPPNSQLVLFAYDDGWRLETFLAPYMTATMLAVIIALVMSVLGGIWIYLEIQEKKSMTDDKLKGSTTTNNFFF